MYTALIRCDNCGKEERDATGWLSVSVTKPRNVKILTVRHFDPEQISQSKWPVEHVCSVECLAVPVGRFAKEIPKRKRRARAKPDAAASEIGEPVSVGLEDGA